MAGYSGISLRMQDLAQTDSDLGLCPGCTTLHSIAGSDIGIAHFHSERKKKWIVSYFTGRRCPLHFAIARAARKFFWLFQLPPTALRPLRIIFDFFKKPCIFPQPSGIMSVDASSKANSHSEEVSNIVNANSATRASPLASGLPLPPPFQPCLEANVKRVKAIVKGHSHPRIRLHQMPPFGKGHRAV